MESRATGFWLVAAAFVALGTLVIGEDLLWLAYPQSHPVVVVVGVATPLGLICIFGYFAREWLSGVFRAARNRGASIGQALLVLTRLALATRFGRAFLAGAGLVVVIVSTRNLVHAVNGNLPGPAIGFGLLVLLAGLLITLAVVAAGSAAQPGYEMAVPYPWGLILFNPPLQMTVGATQRIETRITRLNVPVLYEGGQTLGDVVWDQLRVTLEGTNFEISPLNTADQDLPLHEIRQWAWDVTPRRRGTQKLALLVSHRLRLPNYPDKQVNDAVLEKQVAVTLDPLYAANHFMRTHWPLNRFAPR